MTDPRYHASVTDPDETSPISGERLAELRDGAGDRDGSDRAERADRAERTERVPDTAFDRGLERAPSRADRAPAPRDPAGSHSAPAPSAPGAGPAGGSDLGAAGSHGAAPASQSWYDQRYQGRSGESPRGGGKGQNGYPASYPTPGSSSGGGPAVAGSPVSGRSLGTPPPAGSPRSGRPTGPPTTGATPAAGSGELRGGRSAQPESPFGSLGVGSYGSTTGYGTGATPAAGPASAAGSGSAATPLYGGGAAYQSSQPSGYGNDATSYTGASYGGGYGPPSAYSTTTGRDLDGSGAGLTVGGAAGAVGTGPFVGGATLGTAPSRRAVRAPRGGAASRPARRARLTVKQVDPWSMFKFSLVLAVAMFFVWLVAIGVLYGVLDGIGVFDKINNLYSELSGTNGQRLVTPGLVLGLAALIGAVNIVLTTALATVGAFVYNICSDLVGGIEVTLAERD